MDKKRDIWSDKEVGDMLSIINEKNIMKHLDNKTRRNRDIFEEVAQEMRIKGSKRTLEQVQVKFKALKRDFNCAKKNNEKSGAKRQTCLFYDILNDMLGSRPVITAKGIDTSVTDEAISPELEIVEEGSQLSLGTSTQTTQNSPSCATPSQPKANTNNNNFKNPKKRTYEKVVTSFTKEWKLTQEEILKTAKIQDKEYEESMQKMLENNRMETAKLLENDRLETAKMLNSFISMMQPQINYTSPLISGHFFSQPMNPANGAISIITPTSPPNTPDTDVP